MDKLEKGVKRKVEDDEDLDTGGDSLKYKIKHRVKKRKRTNSASSSDLEDVLPDNAFEVEKSLHASAVKNNLDDQSVKKILKKVVTNDHVLALVKIREQEEAACDQAETGAPKLTRAKAKELMKASTKSAPWSLELTPIKQLPVKTRPEVTALIAQELPEDEDDDEYQPTHDDVPSDDDQTLESCSDMDSQPRTPATPRPSPKLQQDGPFKLPQQTTPARRKLDLQEIEEPTIALRTRSKINLSSTTIEHIESTFVPPDDIPAPRDEEWDQFVSGVFDPTGFREEDDPDETDPEYNVAADPDANEEDDLDGSILRISKKELNDLVTELFSIMPEAAAADELASNLANDVLTDNNTHQVSGKWEGKQETISDEENIQHPKIKDRRDSATKFSIGKSEPEDPTYRQGKETKDAPENVEKPTDDRLLNEKQPPQTPKRNPAVDVRVEEQCIPLKFIKTRTVPPPPLLKGLKAHFTADQVVIREDEASKLEMSTAQLQLLQQQLRQHVQLAASNFLQLFVNPQHWTVAPQYKQYLTQLQSLVDTNPKSIANVCNLKPALDLVNSWEKSVSEDTPENQEMVEFIQKEADRSRRRFNSNSLYVGEFPDTFKRVVANSSVFLYPYLLPAMPYRSENYRKYGYRRCEDELIAMGLDQFWQYLDDNPHLYKRKAVPNPRTRAGLNATATLVSKYMFPWMTTKHLLSHIARVRRDKDNPICRFFETREIRAVQHKLLPFNPDLTLYEQPEHEMPRIWVRYLAKSSKRFRNYLTRRKDSGVPPLDGVPIDIHSNMEAPKKNPLPIDFTKKIISNRCNVLPKEPVVPLQDKFDVEIEDFRRHVDLENTGKETRNGKSNGNILDSAESISDRPKRSITDSATHKNIMTIDAGKIILNNMQKTPSSSQTIETTEAQNDQEPKNNFVSTPYVAKNIFKIIETSTGSFLVPLTVFPTTTVDSIREPISSIVQGSILSNDVEETPKEKDNNHCKCCLMLKKICKEKQTTITDFFHPKRETKCQCSDRKYPRITKRLKMLVNNFKSRSWCVHRELQRKLKLIGNESENILGTAENIIDLEDIAYVTSYQMKLINRTNIARNNYIKKRVNTIFSKFDAELGDVISLTEELFQALEVDLVDLYKEFLGFLTAEQAEKIDKFKDYFKQSCVDDLMKKIESEIPDSDTKTLILSRLSALFFDSTSSSCEMCTTLLDAIPEYPRLATYIFSLFPHRAVVRPDKWVAGKIQKNQQVKQPQPTDIPRTEPVVTINVTERLRTREDSETDGEALTIDETETLTVIDYEADQSDSDVDENMTVVESTNETLTAPQNASIQEPTVNTSNVDTTVTKAEVDDNASGTTEMSALVMSEDEVKTEPESDKEEEEKRVPPEWTRDEDKVILQYLLQYLSPETRQGKSVMEVMRETNLYQVISENLTDKSQSDVRDRVMYLFEILVLSE